MPATSVRRTLLDLACTGPRLTAVAAADSACNRGMLTADELRAARWHLTGRHGGRRGCRLARQVDGNAQSAIETAVRLLLLRRPLAQPTLQHAAVEHGRVLASADLAYPDAKSVDRVRWLVGTRRPRGLPAGQVAAERLDQPRLDRPAFHRARCAAPPRLRRQRRHSRADRARRTANRNLAAA